MLPNVPQGLQGGRERERLTKEDGADVDAVAREELCDGASDGLRGLVSTCGSLNSEAVDSQTWLRWWSSGAEQEARSGWSRSFRSTTAAPLAEMAGLCCPGLAASTRTRLAPSPGRARLAPLDPLVDLAPPTAPRPAPARPRTGTRAGPTPTTRALARAAVRRALEASHFRLAPSHVDADLSAGSPSACTAGPGGELSCSPSTSRRTEGWARVKPTLELLRRLDLRRRAAGAGLSSPCCSSRTSSAPTGPLLYSCYLQDLLRAAPGYWSCGTCSARRLSRPAAARSATLVRPLARVGASGRRCSFRVTSPSLR